MSTFRYWINLKQRRSLQSWNVVEKITSWIQNMKFRKKRYTVMYISPLSPSHLEADQERIREGTLYPLWKLSGIVTPWFWLNLKFMTILLDLLRSMISDPVTCKFRLNVLNPSFQLVITVRAVDWIIYLVSMFWTRFLCFLCLLCSEI